MADAATPGASALAAPYELGLGFKLIADQVPDTQGAPGPAPQAEQPGLAGP
jgi:hypothetical protein